MELMEQYEKFINVVSITSCNQSLRNDYFQSSVIVLSLSLVWLCNPVDCSTQVSPVLHYLLEFAQIMSSESGIQSNHTEC